jgi:hypothetical protein
MPPPPPNNNKNKIKNKNKNKTKTTKIKITRVCCLVCSQYSSYSFNKNKNNKNKNNKNKNNKNKNNACMPLGMSLWFLRFPPMVSLYSFLYGFPP